MREIRLGMAQINSTVGDIEGNVKKIISYIDEAKRMGVDIIIFPEMAVTGYPPEDLLLKPQFIDDNIKGIHEIAIHSEGITAIVGFVDKNVDIYNSAAIINDGEISAIYHKIFLPNYGVFDEYRYFQTGKDIILFSLNRITFGINICEDIWYPNGPERTQALSGGEIIININASPFHAEKVKFKEKMLATRASDNKIILAYVNLVGGQDELVFDGRSMIFNEKGELIEHGRAFEEELIIKDLDADSIFSSRLHDPRGKRDRFLCDPYKEGVKFIKLKDTKRADKSPILSRNIEVLSPIEEIYKALVIGTKDYLRKNGFNKGVVGLSGGIDSSLTGVIAVDALGKDNIIGVILPSQYTSKESIEDAETLAENLGIRVITILIKDIFDSFLKSLSEPFKGKDRDITEENLQARIRGNILMALSNKFGWLVLTTGNKSEMGVGYATLYGDMAGGFAVIKDLPKTMVYELARYRNSISSVIPERVLIKEPTAELKPNQKDTDTLPQYNTLDPILKAYVEDDIPFNEIVKMGYKRDIVEKVIRMIDKSEYKRRQSPPGIKITPRAFGKDRRMPITNAYREFERNS